MSPGIGGAGGNGCGGFGLFGCGIAITVVLVAQIWIAFAPRVRRHGAACTRVAGTSGTQR